MAKNHPQTTLIKGSLLILLAAAVLVLRRMLPRAAASAFLVGGGALPGIYFWMEGSRSLHSQPMAPPPMPPTAGILDALARLGALLLAAGLIGWRHQSAKKTAPQK